MTLFADEIYGKKVPKKYRGELFLYMVNNYDCELK